MGTLALTDIRDIVTWLKHIEESVGSLYARAAEACVQDQQFSTFLTQLAEDEKSHAQFMSMVLGDLPPEKNCLSWTLCLTRKPEIASRRPLNDSTTISAEKVSPKGELWSTWPGQNFLN